MIAFDVFFLCRKPSQMATASSTISVIKAHRLQRRLKKHLLVWALAWFFCYRWMINIYCPLLTYEKWCVRANVCDANTQDSLETKAWLYACPQLSVSSQRSLLPPCPSYRLLMPIHNRMSLASVKKCPAKPYVRPRRSPWKAESLLVSKHLLLKPSWKLRRPRCTMNPSRRQIARLQCQRT